MVRNAQLDLYFWTPPFEGAPNWQAFALRDGPFVNEQNPQSSALVAQHLLQVLGLS